MATKTIQTRIKNRFDTLANWQGTGVTLLPGEIALVSVTTQQINKDTGDVVNVPAILMKVGESDGQGGTKSFDSLPWVSALAADVYDWAKGATSEDIPVTIKVGGTDTQGTLGGWLKSINDQAETNKTGVAANLAAINILNGNNTTVGSVAKAIKDAIEALDVTTSTGKGTFVKAVTQTNGKISVEMGEIAPSELPDISSDKITIGSGKIEGTLSKKLTDMDALIAANTAKLTGHTDDAINTLIGNKLDNLDLTADPTSAGEASATENFVTQVRQSNGQVSYLRKTLPVATSTKKGIVTLGANGGAATYDSVFGTDGKGGINAQIETNKADIASLKTSVTGGVHFIGTVTAKPTASSVSVTKDGNTTTVTAVAGDIVVWSNKSLEYIYTGSSWEELGDPSGLGAMLDALDYNGGDFGTSKFVTKVTQNNGLIEAEYEQPTSADITHGDSTVNAKLGDIDTQLANKSDKDHTHGNIGNDGTLATANAVVVTDANKKVVASTTITTTELGYLDGVTSNIQTQLNGKAASSHGTHVTYGGNGSATSVSRSDHTHSDYETNIAAIEGNYVKFVPDSSDNTKGKLYVGATDTTNVIIFDCGGAADL